MISFLCKERFQQQSFISGWLTVEQGQGECSRELCTALLCLPPQDMLSKGARQKDASILMAWFGKSARYRQRGQQKEDVLQS